jgi:Secretion system C-terminal sorting domain
LIFFAPTFSFFRPDVPHRTSKSELLAQKIPAFLLAIYSVHILIIKHFNVMKPLLLALLLALGFHQANLLAQQPLCTPPASIGVIQPNQIKAFYGTGSLFSNGPDGGLQPFVDQSTSPSTIYTVGLNIGAVDPGGNLYMANRNYYTNGASSYYSGPFDYDGSGQLIETNCSAWDRQFQVSGSDIAQFLMDLPTLTIQTAIQNYPSIMGWPGRGNPYFSTIYSYTLPNSNIGLAPFFDSNNDGNYNPMQGDYPEVQLAGNQRFVPTEFGWSVFRTSGGITPNRNPYIEIHQTIWGFDCPNDPVLQRTIFTSQKFIHRGFENYDSTTIGYFIDYDIGCYVDDYMGTMPTKNAVIGYNADPTDGESGFNCQIPTFEEIAPPVQSAVFLNQTLDKSIYVNNSSIGNVPAATIDPFIDTDIMAILNGYWLDNSPLTYGGNGYGGPEPTDYVFPSDPSDPNGWSECTANLSFGDRRLYATHKFGLWQPGGIHEMTLAWITTFEPDLPCGLGQTGAHIDYIQGLYNTGLSNLCSPVNSTSQITQLDITVTPVPAQNEITINYGDTKVLNINLLSMDGRLVRQVAQPDATQTTLPVHDLVPGFYMVQIEAEHGTAVRSVVVAR